MNQRSRRSPARFLGPLALIVVVVAFFAIVSGSSNHGGGSTSPNVGSTQTTSKDSSTTSRTGTNAATPKPSGPKYYVVKIGDSFSAIAVKTGVTLEKLQALNPNVDSNAMTAGQKIRLR